MEGRVDRSRQAGTARWHGRIRRAGDGGETWTTIDNPCRDALRPTDLARHDADAIVILCEGEAAGWVALKELHRSIDRGTTWAEPSYAPHQGRGMQLDLAADGTGWMWGYGSPLMATADGGATWTALDNAGWGTRQVISADAWGLGAGQMLVLAEDRTRLLLVNADGAVAEKASWALLPCCGG